MKKLNFDKFIEKYLDMSAYGFNLIIKEYANFPRILPLPCHMDHGWSPLSKAAKSDLLTEKSLMLVFSRRHQIAWQKESQIPVAIMGSPFIHYQNIHQITKKTKAKGTIVFPSHSTPALKSCFDVKKYCGQLKKMPKKFQPVTICLLWPDFLDKEADIYRKAGFSVVAAGPKTSGSLEFVKNYYEILSSHIYASSNIVGSYTFYAIELGIPFFILGNTPTLVMKKGRYDPNVPAKYKITDYDLGKHATDLFSTGPIDKISPKQRAFVKKENGTNECLSAEALNKLLWQYFWKGYPFIRIMAYWFLNFARLIRDNFNKIKNVKK